MKVITKVKAIGKACIVCLSVLVSINANAQEVWVSNVTVSEVLIRQINFGTRAYFKTVEPIANPGLCSNTNWYGFSNIGRFYELIKSAKENNLPVNIIIASDRCVGGAYPFVNGVGLAE